MDNSQTNGLTCTNNHGFMPEIECGCFTLSSQVQNTKKDLLRRFPIIVFLIGILAFSVFSQQNEPNLRLIEEFGTVQCEDLQARLDYLLVNIQDNSNSKAYIVIYPSDRFVENFVIRKTILNHYEFRKQDLDRFQVIIGKPRYDLLVQLWVGIDGAVPEIERSELPTHIPDSSLPLQAYTEEVFLSNMNGEYMYPNYDCSLDSADIFLLKEFLDADPRLHLRILIFGESRRNAQKLKTILVRELDQAEIPVGRYSIETRLFLQGKECFDGESDECEKRFIVNFWLTDGRHR